MEKIRSRSHYDLNDCKPNREQTWLLHAAVSEGEQAINAWKLWRDNTDLDTVDPASFRLLPVAYRNLVSLGQDDPQIKRLKGVYRHTWYKNQMIYRQTEDILAGFADAGLSPMVLKGAALTERFYHDDGIRFMNDVDLMVPELEFERAAALMKKLDWQPHLYSQEAMLWYYRHRFKHGCAFKKNNIEVDLHSQLLRFLPQDDETLWSSSNEGYWRGQRVHFLNDTDQLFHTCVHGVRWSYAFLSWIPDALIILQDKSPDISWDSLVQKSIQTRTILYLRNAFAYLVDEFQAPIPDEVIRQLRELPVSWIEKREYRTMGQVQTNSIPYQLRRVVLQSSRYRSSSQSPGRPIGLSLTAWIQFLFVHFHPPGLLVKVKAFYRKLLGTLN